MGQTSFVKVLRYKGRSCPGYSLRHQGKRIRLEKVMGSPTLLRGSGGRGPGREEGSGEGTRTGLCWTNVGKRLAAILPQVVPSLEK